MSDETGAAPVEGTPAPETTTTGPDYGPVMDRLSELAGTVGSLQEGFQQFTQAQTPAEEPTNWWDQILAEGEPQPQGVDQFGNAVQPQAQTPPVNVEALREAMRAEMQQGMGPLQQQLQQMQMAQAREQLYQELPQLREPEVAAKTQEYMNSFLAANNVPPQVAEWLVNSPAFIAQNFKAAEAEKAAGAQVPAGGDVPSLESAGGATPGGDGAQQNPVDQIFATRQAALPKGFT